MHPSTTGYPIQGLYNSTNEHDACGVGFVAHIKGKANHAIIEQGLRILENLDHRGAVGADVLMGDGAGILIQIPDELYREEMAQQDISLPPIGEYGVGMIFLPKEHASRQACIEELERIIKMEGQIVMGWRNVPVNQAIPMSPTVRTTAPIIRQVFIGRGRDVMTTDAFERKLYIIHKRASHAIRALELQHGTEYFVPSMSARTVIYKGLLLANQVGAYYTDLQDKRTLSAMAIVHQRFSTNTFPAWQLAHPYRMIAHNGEINTIKSNVNWINARVKRIASPVLGNDLHKIWPLIFPEQSDTASFDNCLELLIMAGYPLAHAMMMMIPEAWEHHALMDDSRRAFYEYHAAMMEPWDGPAAMIFTDGKQIGATVDRNGLRPARFYITRDDLVVMASEAGVLRLEQNQIAYKGRLSPGKMFLLDMELGRVVDNKTLKNIIANIRPYKSWVEAVCLKLDEMPQPSTSAVVTATVSQVDTAVVPNHLGLLQNNQLLTRTSTFCSTLIRGFAYSENELTFLRAFADELSFAARPCQNNTLAIFSPHSRLLFDYFNQLIAQATNPPIDARHEDLVMSLVSFIGPKPNLLDINNINPPMRLEVAQPILDFASMAKIYDIKRYTRGKFDSYRLNICYPVAWGKEGIEARVASLCAEAADAVGSNYNILILSDRAVDKEHVAIPVLLATSAIHQHLVAAGLRTSTGLVVESGSVREARHFALLAGYGAEAIHPYLAMEIIAEQAAPSVDGIPRKYLTADQTLPVAAEKAIKCFSDAMAEGIKHIIAQAGISTYMSYTGSQMFEAMGLSQRFVDKYFKGTVSSISGLNIFDIAAEALALHQAAFAGDNSTLAVPASSHDCTTLRDLFDFKRQSLKQSISLTEVESAENILKRFIVSNEFIQQQRIDADGVKNLSSQKIETITSKRTNLTVEKLAKADLIKICMVDNQREGYKNVSPHHDIYSIEDLAQLIYDLKNVNPHADVAIKLISQTGIGTVAAGVAKAKADLIVISGHDAKHMRQCSPLMNTYIGSPWEIGLAEVQQTLVINSLRGRVRLQIEGQFNTGRDIVIAALLGAEVFSFTAFPDEILSRINHHDVVKDYFLLIAEEVRQCMAQLGVPQLDDLIGRVDYLDTYKEKMQGKVSGLDLSRIFYQPRIETQIPQRQIVRQDHALDRSLDHTLMHDMQPLWGTPETAISVRAKQTVNNANRTIGALLSGEVARRFDYQKLAQDAIYVHMTGTAGQSFGAFLASGVTLDLEGDANDYVGKSLSGGRIIVRIPQKFYADAKRNIIVGNTVLYGANCGEAFFNGIAGERFAACNAGAVTVIEGVGDHCCEYMTDGIVVVLGKTGRNFAAGMSGGIAYVYDEDGLFRLRCNTRTVTLTPLSSTAQSLHALSNDEAKLKSLIEQHYHYTQSVCAKSILEDWSHTYGKFIKVLPYEIATQP